MAGVEPACTYYPFNAWEIEDLNLGPSAYQTAALPGRANFPLDIQYTNLIFADFPSVIQLLYYMGYITSLESFLSGDNDLYIALLFPRISYINCSVLTAARL